LFAENGTWETAFGKATGREAIAGGAYHDQMVKQGGRWLFRYRKIDRFIAA
jgi:hypothetical protein